MRNRVKDVDDVAWGQGMEWREAWLAAERSEAEAAVQEALDAPSAWSPAHAAWASMDLDAPSPSTGPRCPLLPLTQNDTGPPRGGWGGGRGGALVCLIWWRPGLVIEQSTEQELSPTFVCCYGWQCRCCDCSCRLNWQRSFDQRLCLAGLLCRGTAWQQEFWPSAASEAILAVVADSVRRASWLPTAAQRRAYLAAVPQARCQHEQIRFGFA